MAIIQVPPPDSPPRWKIHLPRISLLTFLLLVTIVCLFVSQWSLVREHRALLAEAKLWRRHVGHLEITDPTKIHAVQVDELQEKTWKWRVYVPDDARVQLCAAVHEIPADGMPAKKPVAMGPERTGEFLVTAAYRLDAKGDWQLVLDAWSTNSGRVSTRLRVMHWDTEWLHSRYTTKSSGAVPGPVVEDDGEPLVLMRLQARHPTATSWDDPSEGLMIWFERTP